VHEGEKETHKHVETVAGGLEHLIHLWCFDAFNCKSLVIKSLTSIRFANRIVAVFSIYPLLLVFTAMMSIFLLQVEF